MHNIRKSPRKRQQKITRQDKAFRVILYPLYLILKPFLNSRTQTPLKIPAWFKTCKIVLSLPILFVWLHTFAKLPKKDELKKQKPIWKKAPAKKEKSRSDKVFDCIFNATIIAVSILVVGVLFGVFPAKDIEKLVSESFITTPVSATTIATTTTTASITTTTTATPKYSISYEELDLLVLAVQHEIGYNGSNALTLYWVDASDSEIMNGEINDWNLEPISYETGIQAMTKIILNNMAKHGNTSLYDEFADSEVWESMYEDLQNPDPSKYNVSDPVTRKNIEIVLEGKDSLPQNLMAEMSMQPEIGECGMNLHDSWSEFREYFYPEYIRCTIYGKNSWDGGWWIAAEELPPEDVAYETE